LTANRTTLRFARALADPTSLDAGDGRAHDLLGLLAAGIPLTLLIDLASPLGPDSRSILFAENVEVQMSHTA